MKKFTEHTGLVAAIDRPNIDTDAIIPKQFLKSIKRAGFGPNAFDDWRYLDEGGPEIDNASRRLNPDFILNKKPFNEATLLLSRENFGCGSSREHAVWALEDFGFRAVIAPSFADIFFNNSYKNGLLPIVLSKTEIEDLFHLFFTEDKVMLSIDLAKQNISYNQQCIAHFEIDAFRKHCLLNGLDDIGLTLQHSEKIQSYEKARKKSAPWLF